MIHRDGEPWFVAKDVCEVLGFRDSHNATRGLDSDEVATLELRGFSRGATLNTIGNPEGNRRGNPIVKTINESGLYSLILKSRKPTAKRFKK